MRKTKFGSGENTVQDPDQDIKVEVGDITMKTNVNNYTYRGSKYHCEACDYITPDRSKMLRHQSSRHTRVEGEVVKQLMDVAGIDVQ